LYKPERALRRRCEVLGDSPLGWSGSVAFYAAVAVIWAYRRKRFPFNLLVSTAIYWALSALGFGLIAVDVGMWRRSQGATFVWVGLWLFLAVMAPLAMRRKVRS
jgi:ABC-type transport system involved in multi-copper enzyme maturation permease subunit